MSAKDYPITELYGCQPGYPLNQNLCPAGQGFHRGIDYGCPVGTPIVVNGVAIGISGATGAVTGPHVHVGRWVGGNSTDPGAGNGWQFNSAVVAEVGSDDTNGKYVALNADGARWVYLHMSDNSKVSVGQELTGDSMEPFNEGDRVNINNYLYGKDLGRFTWCVGKDWKTAMYYGVFETKEYKTDAKFNDGDIPQLQSALGTKDAAGQVGKPWKNVYTDYILPHMPQSDYTPVTDQLYKKKG